MNMKTISGCETISNVGEPCALVVEPVPALARILARMVSHIGYRVIAAAEPDDAFAFAEENGERINLLVTELNLPEIRGAKVASFVTSRNPAVRVLYLSDSPAPLVAPTVGRSAILKKPFSRADLIAAVAQLDGGAPRHHAASG